jgi:imidazolonepropionase-like amidohydrolase
MVKQPAKPQENVMFRAITSVISLLILASCGGDSPESTAAPVAAEPQATSPAPQPGEGAIAYTGAAIWDGTGSATRHGLALLVRDGRIEDVVAEIPAGADVVDLAGRWIVPGFVNAHGHVSGRWADDAVTDAAARVRGDLALYARYGVTTVLSLGGAPAEAFAVRDAQDTAALTHARVLLAGEVVAGNTANEASATALANIERGVDWMKLRVDDNLGTGTKMPWSAVQVAMNAAKASEIPVATHIFYMDDAARLLQTGTGLIAHSVRDREVTDEFVQAMLDTGVCYVPTLVREVSTFVYAERPDWFNDPFFQEAAKQSEIDRVSQPDFRARVAASPAAAGYRKALTQAQDNLRILIGSGVPVAFGTDSGPAGRFLGYFEHLEFDLMAEAGLTAGEILLSATSVAANCLDLDGVGTLEAGKWADFIVLGEDPTRDISATRSIQSVYIAGNEVPR